MRTSDNGLYNELQRMAKSYNEWQWMTTSDNDWQRVTTNENEWQRMTTSDTTDENKWEQVKQSNFKFDDPRKDSLLKTLSRAYHWGLKEVLIKKDP